MDHGVSSGVHQRSDLGPLLFPQFVHSHLQMTLRFLLLRHVLLTAFHCKKNYIKYVNDWCTANKLHLNIEKCRVMSFMKKINQYTLTTTLVEYLLSGAQR